MSKKNTLASEPKLRFPKFKGEKYTTTILGDVAHVIDERAGKNIYPTMSVTSGVGLLSQREKFGREIAGNQYKSYYVIKKWDFAYNKSATKLYPEGYIAMLQNAEIGAVPNSIFTCFRILTDKAAPEYLNFLFHDNFHGKWLKKFIEVGARAHGALSVSEEALMSMPMILPPVDEQQKIADCLSSLDDLITANTQKLEALKAHKKGLMQNLFPQEGETVPRLRFKEFAEESEWQEKELSELGKLIPGLTYKPMDVRENGLLVLRSSNVQNGEIDLEDSVFVDEKIKGANISQPNDILICVRNGSKSLIGKNALLTQDIPISTHGAFMVVFRAHNPKFAYQLLQSDSYKNQVANNLGATINSINGSDLIKYKFHVPSPTEQQKIADCLTSIDVLIKVQFRKINALKEQKKGLMQQLFPSMETQN